MVEAIKFMALLTVLFVLPGMAVLYHDWRHRKGWFLDRR